MLEPILVVFDYRTSNCFLGSLLLLIGVVTKISMVESFLLVLFSAAWMITSHSDFDMNGGTRE